MLIAIVLCLVSNQPGHLPAHLGRANYAATLARIASSSPQLAEQIREGNGPRPLTCSSLLNAPAQGQGTPIEAGKRYYARVTGLLPEVSQALAAGLLGEARPATWELDGHCFRLEDAICDPALDVWSGRATYEGLAAAQLMAGPTLPRQVTFYFAAPTAFKSEKRIMPLPLPALVFGSLVDRWNAFSPITLSPEMRRFGGEMLAITRYRMESRPVEVEKDQGLRVGGVGRVTYSALTNDRYWLGVLHMLANFALYSGVGVQTASGMGQVRRVEANQPPRNRAAKSPAHEPSVDLDDQLEDVE